MSSRPIVPRPFAIRPGSALLVDAAIATAALGGSLLLLSHIGAPGSVTDDIARAARHRTITELDWLGVLLAVGASAPLVAWRRFPVGAFAVTGVASALLVGLGYPPGIPLGAGIALFLLAANRDEEQPWTERTTAVVIVLAGAYLGAAWAERGSFPESVLVRGGLTFAFAWFAGEQVRLRRQHIAELNERVMRAEHEADRERRLAVAEERVRIARDLHDAAGHAINVITVRAGAARMRRDPEHSLAALAAIEELGRQTAAEIAGIVGTLRDPNASNGAAEAPLGLASLDTLIAGHAGAGLEVSVTRTGVPRPLDSAADQAAYRILQEALTNAGRYGMGAARVELEFGEAALEMTISNPARDGSDPTSNGGHGLIGMRERATLLGGSFDADRSNGVFLVRARLPYRGPLS